LFPIVPIFAKVVFDDRMTHEDMDRTGVGELNYSQQMALQDWINENYEQKQEKPKKGIEQLFISLNIEEGAKLELSDGSLYDIDPDDRLYSSFWVTPIPISLGQSKNKEYPVKITNMNTGTSVNGKEISRRQYLEDEAAIERAKPPPKKQLETKKKTPETKKKSPEKQPTQKKPQKPTQK